MAGVSWNSSSMNSFFNNSLNLKTSGMNSIFGTVGDSRMIKSGSYKKLMKSYFDTVDTDDYQKKTSTSGSRHANSYTYDPKEGSSAAPHQQAQVNQDMHVPILTIRREVQSLLSETRCLTSFLISRRKSRPQVQTNF